jgi:hypothetical protein
LILLSCTKEFENFTPDVNIGNIESFFEMAQTPVAILNINTRELGQRIIPIDDDSYLVINPKSFVNQHNELFAGSIKLSLHRQITRSEHLFHYFNGISTNEVFTPYFTLKLVIEGANGEIVDVNPLHPLDIYIGSEKGESLKPYFQALDSKTDKWQELNTAIEFGEWNIQGTEESIEVKAYKSKILKSGSTSFGIKKFNLLGLNSNICLNLPDYSSRMNTKVFLVDKENSLIFKTNHSNEHDFCISKEILVQSDVLEVIILADYGEGQLHYLRSQRSPDRLGSFEYLPKFNTFENIYQDIRQNID